MPRPYAHAAWPVPPYAAAVVIVDGFNVVGAGAGRWWRDRPAAVRRLHDRLAAYAASTGQDVELVLDVAQADLPDGVHAGVTVRTATRAGRDAADDRIRERLDELPTLDGVSVITSDRALREDVRRRGADVVGAGTFLARLDGLGC